MLFLKGIEPCVKYTERLNLCQTFYVILIYEQIFYIRVLFGIFNQFLSLFSSHSCLAGILSFYPIFNYFINTVDLIMALENVETSLLFSNQSGFTSLHIIAVF